MRTATRLALIALCAIMPACYAAKKIESFPTQEAPDPADQMLQEHQFTEARIFLERRLKGHPNDVVILMKLSKAMEGLGELDNAIKLTRKATDIQPKNSQAHFLLAHYLDEDRDELAARVQYEIVIDLKGPVALKLASYGPYLRLIIKDGRFKEAEALAKKWVHQNQFNADCHFNRAWLLAQSVDRKNKEIAVQEYKTCLDLDRKRASARFNLALVLNDLGRKSEAVSQLRSFILQSPDDSDAPKAKELMERLQKATKSSTGAKHHDDASEPGTNSGSEGNGTADGSKNSTQSADKESAGSAPSSTDSMNSDATKTDAEKSDVPKSEGTKTESTTTDSTKTEPAETVSPSKDAGSKDKDSAAKDSEGTTDNANSPKDKGAQSKAATTSPKSKPSPPAKPKKPAKSTVKTPDVRDMPDKPGSMN